MDRATSFAKVIRRLAGEDGLDVRCRDRAGYGSRVDEPIPNPRVVGDALDVLDDLDDADGPAVVVGHSYGGHVALAASLLRPERVAAAVIYETPIAWAEWWPPNTSGGLAVRAATPAEAAETFMRSIVGDAVWERLPAKTRAARRAEGPALLADMADIRTAAPYDPTAVTVPVVIGRGSASKGHHRLGTEEWQRLLPHAECRIVEGAGHGAHTSHPDGFADLVRAARARARTAEA